MGHKRLGDLPNTGGWKRFKTVLADQGFGAEEVAETAFDALTDHLIKLRDDPGLGYCYWVITQLVWPARDENYLNILKNEGFDIGAREEINSPITFITKISNIVQTNLNRDNNSTVFSNIAQLAFRETLTREFNQQTGSLFGTNFDDVQGALRKFGTKKSFGALSRNFFSNYVTRLLGYFIEREVPNHVGPRKRFKNTDDVRRFEQTVKTVCEKQTEPLNAYFKERAKIIEEYSGSYSSLHDYREDLTLNNIRKEFVPRALVKIRDELKKAERDKGNNGGDVS